ncbi:hdod family domain protein [Vibrio cholerae HE39]|nr:hdod family domain protein [Vibrio cholerae HE39]
MNMVKNTMLNRLNELPRLSKVLQELLDMANQPDVDFHQLSKKNHAGSNPDSAFAPHG